MTIRTSAALFLGAAAISIVCAAPALAAPDPGVNAASMDASVKPGDDFYSYANGSWMKATTIPADRAAVGGFLVAALKTEAQLNALIAQIATSTAPASSVEGKIRDYHRAYLDTAAINAAGMAPVQADMARYAAIANGHDLSRVLGENLRADVDPINATNFATENLFGVFVSESLAGHGVMPYLMQGGLGLPEREYYLDADPKMAEIRGKYKIYIAQLLTDAGIADGAARAERVVALEGKIALAHESRAQSEDLKLGSGEWSRADLLAKAPGIDWDAFLGAAGLGQQQTFAAYHGAAIPALAALVASEPLAAWQDWLTFHHLNQYAGVLPSKLEDDRFAFFGTTLSGVTRQRPRDKRAINAVNGALGDALGKLYVEKNFAPADKAAIGAMVERIKTAFAHRIEGLTWMAPATKAEAVAKVRGIVVGVGYPDTWRDYSALTVTPTTAYANARAAGLVGYHQQIAKIGKPLDRGEWWMNAQLVNAVNLPVQNALNFPAAILQDPFYRPGADAAFNYGAIGAVIGHEISHSFDNGGADFDAHGKMRNWWTDADRAHFDAAGKALARQFDGYEPFPGVHVKGDLTLGENIADVAGLAAAYDAYRASLKGKMAPVIAGMTGDQRFFLAFAQSWASKEREAAQRAQLAVDGHAPGQYRALTVRNLDAWYKAFAVKPGDKLYLAPEQRVKVW